MLRKILFAAILAVVAMSVVFSMIGVLSVWNPMELFKYGRG